jgi:phosphatidylinositol glycan class B
MTEKHFFRLILVLALIVYMVTAFFSNGYYHADEHYQIIEFAELKLGTDAPADLAWEYHYKIRTALQPSLCYVLFSFLKFCSITDPYLQTFILRSITGILAVLAIYYFIKSTTLLIKPHWRKVYYVLSYFVWFLPWLNVRYSSEAWSGLFFLLAIASLLRNKNTLISYFIIGALLAFSFIFRFQTAFLSFGLILWLILIKKEDKKNIVTLCFSGLAVIVICLFVDAWFYGEFTISFINYFYSNIYKDIASSFGISPWYYYLYYTFRFSFFPIGSTIIIAFAFIIFKFPKNIFVWCILPFLIIHSIIPHKELRFLFPLINFIPIILILAIQELFDSKNWMPKWFKIISVFIVTSLVFINLTGLIVMTFKPAGFGAIEIAQYMQRNFKDKPVNLISFDGSNPYDPWNGLHAKFYESNNIHELRLNSLNELNRTILKDSMVNLLVLKRKDISKTYALHFIEKAGLVKEKQSIPKWMEPILDLYGGFKNSEILVLYSFKTNL